MDIMCLTAGGVAAIAPAVTKRESNPAIDLDFARFVAVIEGNDSAPVESLVLAEQDEDDALTDPEAAGGEVDHDTVNEAPLAEQGVLILTHSRLSEKIAQATSAESAMQQTTGSARVNGHDPLPFQNGLREPERFSQFSKPAQIDPLGGDTFPVSSGRTDTDSSDPRQPAGQEHAPALRGIFQVTETGTRGIRTGTDMSSEPAFDRIAPALLPETGEPEPFSPQAVQEVGSVGSDQMKVQVLGEMPQPKAAHAPSFQAYQVARQVADRLMGRAEGHLEVVLSPEELGKVRLLITAGEALSVMVSADRPETFDLLRRHADILAKELREAGLEGADVCFSEDGDTADGSNAAKVFNLQDRPPSGREADPVVEMKQAGKSSDHRIDLRV